MIPKQAIEKAIEGGWKPDKITMYGAQEWRDLFALDPTFWQSLGKALGWRDFVDDENVMSAYFGETWRYNAMRFYDLILTGGDLEAF